MTIEDFLRRLDCVKELGSSYAARCPGHRDKRPSLSVCEGRGGRILIWCHAGCSTSRVLKSLSLDWRDLFPDRTA